MIHWTGKKKKNWGCVCFKLFHTHKMQLIKWRDVFFFVSRRFCFFLPSRSWARSLSPAHCDNLSFPPIRLMTLLTADYFTLETAAHPSRRPRMGVYFATSLHWVKDGTDSFVAFSSFVFVSFCFFLKLPVSSNNHHLLTTSKNTQGNRHESMREQTGGESK